ncbi:MAG: exopolysaccharide biosynthesis polyprenyl glycosylphosphotransferase [Pseudomonadota bacterium]
MSLGILVFTLLAALAGATLGRVRAAAAMRASRAAFAPVIERDFSQDVAVHGPLKRTIDLSASVALLVVAAPLLLLVACFIKLDSPGPVIYRQRRVGFQGQAFSVYKFRSMRLDAEKDGPRYAAVNDQRVTKVGRLIRKTRIDEIPQVINVLRGEMSFVGPRPERPEFVSDLERAIPNYHARHLVKPGITGWAQVKYHYAATIEGAREKLRYDLEYMQRYTPVLDLIIILMTVRVALFGVGSR